MVKYFIFWTVLMMFSLPFQVMSQPVSEEITVRQLLADNWQVIDRQERFKELPSVPPYQKLKRTLLVTTFVMKKNHSQYQCVLTYDSQIESFDEVCETLQ